MESAWEQFCANAVNSTFQHTRSFLNYHRDRFKDTSALVMDGDKILGVFSAAEEPENSLTVISHPGATYGGIVHQGKLLGNAMIEAVDMLREHYRRLGYSTLVYKVLPYIYASAASQDDLYALYRLDAVRVRCELSSCIDLANQRKISSRRKRGLKKAKQKVSLSTETELLPDLWAVVEDNLSRKHDARPVHTVSELQLLLQCFPDKIKLNCALIDDKVEAGIVLFNSNHAWHAQYIASSQIGYSCSALDAVFDAAIEDARCAEVRYFDFGTSNEDRGRVLNDGLYQFKSEFGGGGIVHEYYELSLN